MKAEPQAKVTGDKIEIRCDSRTRVVRKVRESDKTDYPDAFKAVKKRGRPKKEPVNDVEGTSQPDAS